MSLLKWTPEEARYLAAMRVAAFQSGRHRGLVDAHSVHMSADRMPASIKQAERDVDEALEELNAARQSLGLPPVGQDEIEY